MLKKFTLLSALLAVTLLTGCAGAVFAPKGAMQGMLFAENNSNVMVDDDEQAAFSKMGESCAKSILGWVTIGDSSVSAAAKKANITNVGVVDNHFFNVLGVYAEFCVQVHGN